jgi:hypothetical protein
MTTTTPPPVVVRDVFPARVVVGDAAYTSARAVITRDRLLVWVPRGRDRLLVVDEAYDPGRSTVPRYNAPPRESAYLTLPDGRTAGVHRQRGCGCASPLRGWRPWSPFLVAAS